MESVLQFVNCRRVESRRIAIGWILSPIPHRPIVLTNNTQCSRSALITTGDAPMRTQRTVVIGAGARSAQPQSYAGNRAYIVMNASSDGTRPRRSSKKRNQGPTTRHKIKKAERRKELIDFEPIETRASRIYKEKMEKNPEAPLSVGWDSDDDEFWKAMWDEEVAFRGPDVPELQAAGYAPSYEEIAARFDEDAIFKQIEQDPEFETLPEAVQEMIKNRDFAGKFDLKKGFFVPTGKAPNWERLQSVPLPWETEEYLPEPLTLGQNGWRLVILGTSSAVPTRYRNVSAAAFAAMPLDRSLLEPQTKKTKAKTKETSETKATPNHPYLGLPSDPTVFLVDAGENTFRRLLNLKWFRGQGFRWLRHIFITHVHGDHLYGLPGVILAIGYFTQKRRRRAILHPEEDIDDPIIHIYGPYGVRGFLRTSLHFQDVVGVRFCIHELIPRETDFSHITEADMWRPGNSDLLPEGLSLEDWHPSMDGVPPPHLEEVYGEDIEADENGIWNLVEDERTGVRVTASPLVHRVPCFGYVFHESTDVQKVRELQKKQKKNAPKHAPSVAAFGSEPVSETNELAVVDIDMDKAASLGVKGRQFAVLRSGRSVVVKSSGLTVRPEDVKLESLIGSPADNGKAVENANTGEQESYTVPEEPRKVVLLGDNCEASLIVTSAMNADVVVHEATFSNALMDNAMIAMHSTSGMAGEFAKRIRAKKLVLTHFSSRYQTRYVGRDDKESDSKGGVRVATDSESEDEEEEDYNMDEIDEDSLFSRNSSTESDDTQNEIPTPLHVESSEEEEIASTPARATEDDLCQVDVLIQEAVESFGSDNVVAAYDYFTLDFPPTNKR